MVKWCDRPIQIVAISIKKRTAESPCWVSENRFNWGVPQSYEYSSKLNGCCVVCFYFTTWLPLEKQQKQPICAAGAYHSAPILPLLRTWSTEEVGGLNHIRISGHGLPMSIEMPRIIGAENGIVGRVRWFDHLSLLDRFGLLWSTHTFGKNI